MPRVRGPGPLVAWLMALAAGAAVTSPVSAADPTPQVNEFGIPVDPSGDLVLPMLLVLVVVVGGLIAAAIVAYRLRREAAALPHATDTSAWWQCAECGATNAGDRDACFSCRVGRPPGGPSTPPPLV